MRNAWGSADDTPTTSLKKVVRIKTSDLHPSPNSTNLAKQIRNDILRNEFDYTDAEIADFNTAHPADWVIEDTRFKNQWATDSQVKGWKAEKDGLVPIVLEEPFVKAVQGFQEQRVSFEAFKVGMFITNAEIKKNLTEDFENILASYGNKRIYALNNLMVTIGSSPSSRGEIYKALRYLSNESGYKNNPFLMIALASIPTYKSDTPSFSSADVNQGTIANAVNIAYNNLYNNPAKSSVVKISRTEAAQINEWASTLYSNINANDQATDRSWIARFLKVDENERKNANEGDIISIALPGQNVARPQSNYGKDLENLKKDRAKTGQMWEEIDRGKRDVEPTDPRADNRTGTQFDETFNVKEQVWNRRDGSKPPEQSRPNTYTNQVQSSRELGSVSSGKLKTAGGLLYLFFEYFKWQTFHTRMAAITKYLIEKERLEDKIGAENVYVVPFKPARIEAIIKDFRRNGRITASPTEKRLIVQTLDQLQSLLEESYAYWGK